MEINFAFLKNKPLLADLFPAADKLLKLYQLAFYRDAIINTRLLLETLSKKMILFAGLNEYYPLPDGEYYNLRNNTAYLRQQGTYPLSIMHLFDDARRLGNAAVHDQKYQPNKAQAWHCLTDVHDLLVYVLNTYTGQNLFYLRPDLSVEAQMHAHDWYRPKKLH